jgi:hypothetical protein
LVVELIVDPDNSGGSLTNANLHVDLLHYTLAAVPEPGALTLMIAGLFVVGGTACRRGARA